MRKYGKVILAVLGVVLMVIWMLPNKGGHEGADLSKVEVGKLGGVTVTEADLYRARNDILVLQLFGERLQAARLPSGYGLLRFVSELDPQHQQLHLYLLLREAQKYNLWNPAQISNLDEINQFIANMGLQQNQIEAILTSQHVDPPIFRNAIADFLTVERLNQLAYSTLQPSLPEIRHLGTALHSLVSVRYASLDASKPVAGLPAPTAAEIETQFNLYKEVLPPEAGITPAEIQGHRYPFGYKYPDRVQVEFLTFNRKAARAIVEANRTPQQRQDDLLAAYKDYQANPNLFRDNATTEPAATAPATPKWEAVASKYVEQKIEERVSSFLKLATDEALKASGVSWRDTAPDKEGYRPIPPADQWAPYAKVAEIIAKNPRFNGYTPIATPQTQWLSQKDLTSLEGIGDALYATQMKDYSLAELALHVREIQRNAKDPILRVQQVGAEGPVLTDPQGNQYIYRVVNAQKAHMPATLDEVRPQVVADIQKRKTFEQYSQRGMILAQEAAQRGLPSVASQQKLTDHELPAFSRLVGPSEEQASMSLRYPALQGLGVVPEFSNAAFEIAAQQTSESSATQAAATHPATSQPTPHKTGSVAVEPRLEVFLLEVVRFAPMPRELFDSEAVRGNLSQLAMMEAARTFIPKWWRLTSVSERLGFVPNESFREEE